MRGRCRHAGPATPLALARLALGDPFDRDAIYRGATQEEGHPDNAGPAVFGGLVLAAHRATRLPLHRDLAVAFAVPAATVSTKAARDLLPTDVPRDVAVQQAARSAALVLGLSWGDPDLIDFGMDDRLAVPHRRRLIPGYDAAVAAGLDAGAYGVSICGAGSALVAVAARADVVGVAGRMAEVLTAAGNPAEPRVARHADDSAGPSMEARAVAAVARALLELSSGEKRALRRSPARGSGGVCAGEGNEGSDGGAA